MQSLSICYKSYSICVKCLLYLQSKFKLHCNIRNLLYWCQGSHYFVGGVISFRLIDWGSYFCLVYYDLGSYYFRRVKIHRGIDKFLLILLKLFVSWSYFHFTWSFLLSLAHLTFSLNNVFNPSYPGLFWSGESPAGGQFCPRLIVSDRNGLLTWNLVQSYIVLLQIACWKKNLKFFIFMWWSHWISQQFEKFS